MRRQRETSELLFGHTELPIIIDERLRQIDNGPHYTGMDSKKAKQDYLDYIEEPFPGGESFNNFAERVKSFLDEIFAKYEQHIVITIGWRLSPAIFAHVCQGVSLKDAILNVKHIKGPFLYPRDVSRAILDEFGRGSIKPW